MTPPVVARPPRSTVARWWSATRTGTSFALGRIAGGVLVAHFVLVFFPRSLVHTRLGTLSSGTWFGAFDRWDAGHYLAIAAHGYPAATPDLRAFFPGYPLVVRVVHDATGGVLSYGQVGCLVSMAAFAVAAGLLYREVRLRYGTRAALASAALFAWFPTSVFFLAPYSEALFALEILSCFTLIGRGRWWAAALVAGYASATSPEAVALTAALVVAALVARRGPARAVGYGVVGSLGAAAYCLFLGVRFGEPFAFATVLPDFHRQVVVPFGGIVSNLVSLPHALATAGTAPADIRPFIYDVAWMQWLDDTVVLVAVVSLVVLAVRLVAELRTGATLRDTTVPVGWLVLLAGIVVAASSTVIRVPGAPDSPEGAARLVSVAFPLYAGLYLAVRRWPTLVIVGIGLSASLAVLTQVLFNLGYWVT